jgi:hypothetical protein
MYAIGDLYDEDFRMFHPGANLCGIKEQFMETNQGPVDRIVRSVVGATLLAIVAFSLEGPVALVEGAIALVIGAVGAVTLLTGLIGWCPTYALLGISTCSDRHAAH